MAQPAPAAKEPPEAAAKHHRSSSSSSNSARQAHYHHAGSSRRTVTPRKAHPPVSGTSKGPTAPRRSTTSKHPHTGSVTCPYCRSTGRDTASASSSASTTSFLCVACSKQRITRYLDHLDKLRADTRHARDRVEALLGPLPDDDETDPHAPLPDPFGPQSDLPRNPHPVASHAARHVRAEWQSLNDRIATHRKQLTTSEEECATIRSTLAERRTQIKERRRRLELAKQTISDDAATQGDAAWYKCSLQRDILDLKKQSKQVNDAWSRATRSKFQAILSIYGISPPNASSQHQRTQHRIPGSFPRPPVLPPPVTGPHAEWTILSFLSPSNHLSIPLPTSSDLARFKRDDMNASVALVAHLQWLLADLAGVVLPFTVGLAEKKGSKGRKWTCKVDPMLSSSVHGLGSLVQPRVNCTLHLGKSAYGSLISHQQSIINPLGASSSSSSSSSQESSIVSLGMSTITSTLESFVHLPVGAGAGAGASAEPSSSSSTTSSSTNSTSVQEFQLALTMLSYNAAYLCWSQGDHSVDLLRAGGPVLELLWQFLSNRSQRPSTGLGSVSASASASTPPDLSTRPPVEFGKLVQLHGIGVSVGGRTSPGSGSKSTGQQGPRTRPRTATSALKRIDESYVDAGQRDAQGNGDARGDSTATQRRMDESYVDAASDAASVVFRDKTHSTGMKTATRSATVRSQRSQASTNAAVGNAPAPAPTPAAAATPPPPTTTLQSLRQRGQKARSEDHSVPGGSVPAQRASTSKPKPTPSKAPPAKAASPATTASPAAPPPPPSASSSSSSRPGVVIFNGKEIRSQRSESTTESADEGDWEAV